jgi:pSer/pThr/pTyr-binding forkhead associated (FHA) protein
MKRIIVGRASDCDYVIIDPKRRVSRRHLEIISNDGKFYLKDLDSLNGTFVNDIKVLPNLSVEVSNNHKITLGTDYRLNLNEILSDHSTESEGTLVYSSRSSEEGERTILSEGGRKTVFDKNNVQIDEISEIDKSPFKTIGRIAGNTIVINLPNVSRLHCKMRLISPMILEIEDLDSTNGTYADQNKLIPFTKYRFTSNVKISLGKDTNLDLKKIFPEVVIVPKVNQIPTQKSNNRELELSDDEKKAFFELEYVWNEYLERQNEMNSLGGKYSIGGVIVGGIGSFIFGGPVGVVMSIGGGVLGRYIGQQKTNELRADSSYENMFLQVYSCPRCKESFQKKPWITINDCFKCKSKFR